MAKNSNYSILVDCELNLKDIEKQLKSQKYKLDFDTKSVKQSTDDIDKAKKATDSLKDATESLGFTYQQFRLIADACVSTIKSMYEQVLELDGAITEFQKVSDLSGKQLDSYVSNLSKVGLEVSRTGKPNRSEPVCCDGKAA